MEVVTLIPKQLNTMNEKVNYLFFFINFNCLAPRKLTVSPTDIAKYRIKHIEFTPARFDDSR